MQAQILVYLFVRTAAFAG